VPLVYFDASALVKLVVEEEGSDVAATLWDGCDAALSSRIAYPEVCAALAAANRNHDLDDDGYATAVRDWEEFWAAVRGADAVHLASAIAVDVSDLVVAVWDRRLHAAAAAEQLTVAPAAVGN
jgi:uncharacterized protein